MVGGDVGEGHREWLRRGWSDKWYVVLEVVCLCDAAAVTSGSKSQVRVFVSFYLTKRQP